MFKDAITKLQSDIVRYNRSSRYIHQKIVFDGSPSYFSTSELTITEVKEALACEIMSAKDKGEYKGTVDMTGNIIKYKAKSMKTLYYTNKYPYRMCLKICLSRPDCAGVVNSIQMSLPDIIKEITPDARLILILREPVSR